MHRTLPVGANDDQQDSPDEAMNAWFRRHFGDGLGAGVTVAVVDSGWRSDWTDPVVQLGFSILPKTNPARDISASATEDKLGHGSSCILLVRELAPKASILPVKVFDRVLEASPSQVTAAIYAAVQAGADIINLSLSTRRLDGMPELYAACAYAESAGVIIVSSADRNDGGFPASFNNVIGVAGRALRGRFQYGLNPCPQMDFSANHRTHITTPTAVRERLAVRGTTYAAPVLAGVVARLRETAGPIRLQEAIQWLETHAPITSARGISDMGCTHSHTSQ